MREFLYKLKWGKYHPQAFAKFAELQRHEHLPLEQLMAMQETARQQIVSAAYNNTALYRQHYSASGFELGDMKQVGWFEKLPIVTKQHLREHFEEMTDSRLKAFRRISTTGGSTGTPTKTGYDGRANEEIYSWRLQSWFGIHPWDDHAYVWRDTRSSRIAQLKNAAIWWPTRHVKLNASFITEAAIENFLRECRRVQPVLLQGYVGALVQLAEYVNHHCTPTPLSYTSLPSPIPTLRFVWTTSAPLPAAHRKLLMDTFHAPVCDQYGSCEIRWIAQQCAECGGLHVNTDHVNIEFVNDDIQPVTEGEYGRTLLTDLENFVFPLIRYENGDRGRWLNASCPCGRTLPLIDSVKGREVESFTLPSGKTINGEYLTTIFDATPDIVQGFRVIQHKDLSITIEYIPSSNSFSSLITQVLNTFSVKLGGEVPISFQQVESIPHDRGKLRFVIKEK